MRLLVVEDERAIQLALTGLFKKEGYEVVVADGAPAALSRIEAGGIDGIVTDLSLGKGGSGLDVLQAAKKAHPDVPVVLITAHGSEKIAVEAMKAGADDYVPKPFDNDELRLVVRRALERTALVREHRALRERMERERGLGSMIGTGPRMRDVFSVIQKVAETDLTVLVRGESGTGKELVAEALHQRSSRRNGPFIAVNCAAISRELVESELFGHEKGAFTGATARRTGRFEAASGGTLFLDEIGDMPLETQAKVLRVLEERKVERVGSNTGVPVDVRVVAATHRDLEADVQKGRFRGDLYFRLSVVPIVLPPLRDRPEDVPLLAERFLAKLAERLGRPAPALSAEALKKLAAHPFPGNVRELRNVVEQAAVLAAGTEIEASDLRLMPLPVDLGVGWTSGTSFADEKRRHVEAFERRFLREALDAHGGNVSRTAQAIGLARQSLQQKLRELGVRASDDDGAD
ncbi:MAG TPA: sigma-54 dependent transcriptional regulator [Polyangiaceae bacterium]|nr:sigma-54 dependent transcriptional regulator [Polyangiaceae bacterium]